MPLPVDSALNLLWVAISVSGVAALMRDEGRRRRYSGSGRRTRLCAVLLCAVCLFPAVSSSDDVFSLSWLQSHLRERRGVGGAPAGQPDHEQPHHLFRILQTLDHWHTESFFQLLPAMRYVGAVSLPGESFAGRQWRCRAGRSPPAV